ncbi:MAG: peptide deformylase [Desulfamplus sp.]|nr:peptide deformylase [Desulfamplus sp.]
MFNAPGVGLAAPQVRSDKRVIVYNPNAGNEKRSEDDDNCDENEIDEDDFEQTDSDIDETDGDILANEESEDNANFAKNSKSVKDNKHNEEYRAIINPEIIAASGSLISENEACLSVPDYSADVKRFSKITVRGLNVDGKKIQFTTEDIQAVIIQHEIDHLEGVLYIDRISMLKRNMYKKKIKKQSQTK